LTESLPIPTLATKRKEADLEATHILNARSSGFSGHVWYQLSSARVKSRMAAVRSEFISIHIGYRYQQGRKTKKKGEGERRKPKRKKNN